MAARQSTGASLTQQESQAVLKALDRIAEPAAIRRALDGGAIPNLGSAMAKLGAGRRRIA